MRATGSTTSPACCACRRRCSSSTWRRRARSAAWRSASDTDVVRLAYRVPPDDSQEDHVEGLPLGTRGGLLFRHNFPQDAEYEFSVFLLRNIVGYMTGLEFAHQLEITIDGERVFAVQVGGETDNLASDTNMSEAANKIDERLKTRVKVKAGPHMVGVTFVRAQRVGVGRAAAAARARSRSAEHERHPADRSRERDRPVQPDRSWRHAEPPPHLHLQARAAPPRKRPARGTILSTLARRAYRRPVTERRHGAAPRALRRRAGRRATSTPASSRALRLILASPKFLFRIEADAGDAAAGTRQRPRAGVAAVVLPLEHHPGRRAARRSRRRAR